MDVYNFNFKVIHSTKSTLDGYNVSEVWKREELQRLNLRTIYPDYKWPKLSQSLYKDYEALINKPVTIQDMKWSCDGTSIITVSNDTGIRQYLIPEENNDGLVTEGDDAGINLLTPFVRKFKNKSIVCSEIHPLNSMYDNDYNFVLLSSREMPIQMYNLNLQNEEEEDDDDDGSVKEKHSNVRYSYDTMNPINERFELPFCIKVYSHQRNNIYTGGANNKIKIYDMNRSLPIYQYSIGKKHSNRSIISCFEDKSNNYVVNNKVILWANYKNQFGQLDTRCDPRYLNETNRARYQIPQNIGNGIYQMIRSDNDRYLYILLRKSNVMQIFEMRNMDIGPINQLRLPFRIGYQKILASIIEDQGLVIGSNQNTLLVWDKALIESGGITKRNQEEMKYSFNTMPIDKLDNATKRTRINIISQNPNSNNSDNNYIAISSSFDRNCLVDATTAIKPQSSLSVLGLSQ